MLRGGGLAAQDAQGVQSRGRRLSPLSGRQRHHRRARHVGLDRGRAQAWRPICMTTSPIYLTEAEGGRLVTVKAAIDTLSSMFATWGDPGPPNLPPRLPRLQ